MKHTKGPWKLITLNGKLPPVRELKSSHGEAPHYQSTIRAGEDYDSAIVCRLDFGYGKPEDEANARLIATTPDLLEALEKIVKLEDLTTDETVRRIANEAIQKAKQ